MKVTNPLTAEFVSHYPTEAARVLEQVSAVHVAALFSELPLPMVTAVMTSMLPERAAVCLAQMAELQAAKLISTLAIVSAARIYRRLTPAKQDAVSALMSNKTRSEIRRYLRYPRALAGALLNPGIDMLPENVTVAEALRRIERLGHAVCCEIYIIDDAHHLMGMIDLGRLLASSRHARMRDIMNRKTQPVSVHAAIATLLSHPGWATRRRLPVVERDNTLLGMLDYSQLCGSVDELQASASRDPLGNVLSLASLYWISGVQLLDSVLNMGELNVDSKVDANKRKRH